MSHWGKKWRAPNICLPRVNGCLHVLGAANEAEVVLSVGDVNDNPPRFTEEPIIVGMPEDASYNHLVTVLEVMHSLPTIMGN